MRSHKKSDYSLNKGTAPILTNTTLNVIRLLGKYTHAHAHSQARALAHPNTPTHMLAHAQRRPETFP